MTLSTVTQTNQNWTNRRAKVSAESLGKSPLGSAAIGKNLLEIYYCVESKKISKKHSKNRCFLKVDGNEK